ncbi:MAG: amidohydrolase family protein [Bdellovibrionota bacterium]
MRRMLRALPLTLSLFCVASCSLAQEPPPDGFNDSHFHLTNYVQEGITPKQFLSIMGDRVQRSTLFGIPLQQHWSYRVNGDVAPTYYLDTDADLYYYSFTDAAIAMAFRSLSPAEQKRFDPMITGFNPADMYAADHIKRVLKTFPGVFVGIGEFTIHKEFVSSKIAGDVASLTDPALDRILDFAAEAGLVAIIHNDMAMPFPKPEMEHTYSDQMIALLRRHPNSAIIWAHTGLGRVVRPIHDHMRVLESILSDPQLSNVSFDISWDEVAKYFVESPESTKAAADLINRFPTRFLFGTDTVAPATAEKYFSIYEKYKPLFALLTPDASRRVRFENYVQIFDRARARVREWEHKNL